MDDTKTELAADILKTLSNPNRLKIVDLISQQLVLSPLQIQEQTAMSYIFTAQHLIKLNDRGIVNRVRRGKGAFYTLAGPMLTD